MGLGRVLVRQEKTTEKPDPVVAETRSLGEFAMRFENSGEYLGWGPYRGALAIPAVRRCVTLIADRIAASPMHAYRALPDGSNVRVTPTPPLLENPTAGAESRISTWSNWITDYLLEGNLIGVFVAWNDAGYPTAVAPVPARAVSVRYTDAATVYGMPQLGTLIEYEIYGKTYQSWDVLHIKAISEPGCLRGLGVLESALPTLQLSAALDKQARGVADNGVPSGVIMAGTNSSITSPDDLREVKQQWLDAQADGRTVQALAPGMDFKPVAWNAEESQLVEARKFTDTQIANLFGVPARYLNAEVGGLTYSTPELDSNALLTYTLEGILVRIEQELSRHLEPGDWAKINRDAILNVDTTTRYGAHAAAIAAGWKTVDEVRAIEDMAPMPSVPVPSPEVEQALSLATAAPSLVQNPGLPALVDQLRALNGKPALSAGGDVQEGDA